MPTIIIKLNNPKTGNDNYLLWSTIVDAPISYGELLDNFKQAYILLNGLNAERELAGRLVRVEEKGTSDYFDADVDETISGNRAGEGKTCLTKEQIIEQYCHA